MAHGSFWRRVNQQIKAHKYSQQKLADYIKVPVKTLKGWIYHNRIPDAVTACKIAESLGVTVEYFVRGRDDISDKIRMKQTLTRKTASKRIEKLSTQITKESLKIWE